MKKTCCECGKSRERCRPVIKHIDGHIDYVCPKCWLEFDYAPFWAHPPKPLP